MQRRSLCVLVLLLGSSPGTTSADGEDFDKAVRPFLDAHCVRCHGPQKQKGEFRVDTLTRDFANGSAAVRWGDVLERLNTGEMPPKGEPKPKPDDSARV